MLTSPLNVEGQSSLCMQSPAGHTDIHPANSQCELLVSTLRCKAGKRSWDWVTMISAWHLHISLMGVDIDAYCN